MPATGPRSEHRLRRQAMAGKGRRHEVAVDHGSRLAPDRRACAREIHKWASLRSVGRSQACRLGATSTSVRATRAALRHSLIGTTKQVSARTNHSASRQSHGSQTTRRTPINPVTGPVARRRSDSRVAASRNEKAIVKLAYAIESAMRAQHRLRRDFSRPADSTCLPSLSMLRWERPTGGWQETSPVSGRSGRAPPRARLCRRVCR